MRSRLAIDFRCRKEEALAVVERGVVACGIEPGQLVLGTDNGTAYTSRGFRARLRELEIAHRRGGYCDPGSQAFIESWFGKLKERLIWREEFETLDRLARQSAPTSSAITSAPTSSSATAPRRR